MAVGGYGRRELCPGSDLDLLLLHRGRGDRRHAEEVAQQLWYPLWDSGLRLGQSIRTVKEAVALAESDLDTATALLDTRSLAGEAAMAEDVRARALGRWRAAAGRWLRELDRSVQDRHERAGEVAFLLEPDLKAGRGGLRDVHALGWVEATGRLLVEVDRQSLDEARDVILGARVELQRRSGKPSDRLLLQDQDAVAAALGYSDADDLMAAVAAAARTIAWNSDEVWRRVRSSLEGPRGHVAATDRPLATGLVLREGAVELARGADPASDPTLALRAAAAAANAGAPLGRACLARLADVPPLPEPWPEEARRALLRLLGAGQPAVGVLETLDQIGVLVRFLPEWEAVRSRPQRNAYHRFTVDRHLCETAAGAAALSARVRRPDLLLAGAWLHDIGKGFVPSRGPDHTEAGVVVVEEVARRLGFPPADVEVLANLVRHHLLLADAATRRDLSDPATVEAVAEAVGDPSTLELLHALTEADSQATGPAAWSPWKAGLVSELVARVDAVLVGQTADGGPAFPGPEHLELVAAARDRGLAISASGRSLTVAATDRTGLFAEVAGVLALNRLDVLEARAWSSDDGMAVEDFVVEPLFGGETDWSRVEEQLVQATTGRLALAERVAERARHYAGRPRETSARPARTQVTVDDGASARATVVEVRAPDGVGTLYRITRTLCALGLDIRSAKVATLGHEVVDSFYVVDRHAPDGAGSVSAERAAEIEEALLAELATG